MTKTQSTVLSGQTTGVDGNGNTTWSASYDPNQPWIKVTAQACDKSKVEILSFSNNKCCCGSEGKADCAGLPIRMSNGNMRFTDSDPLPGMTLSRTYDSSNSDVGWFGPGWTSLLDEWLRTETEVNGSTTVAIGTGDDDRFFFNNQDGAFEQLWPEGSSSSSLRSDGGGGYVLREFGSTTERYFSSIGRLYKTRDVRNGRETAFLYDANGLIVSIVDSWGNWSWSITTDANHHITSIAVPGTSIVWTYTYSSGVLVSAQESGTAWRTYTYAGGVLTAVNDGAGNLIESHAYGPNGATSSIGQTDDITSITYNNTTSDPTLHYTHVTMATGATADYYQRFIGGRYRTERVDGGCTSCTSRNAIYAYDESGHLLREQNARGYITQRTYDGLNRIVSESTALKPDGCDPDTASDHCRLISGLGTATLTATTATVARVFTYDSVWYDRPTSITAISVLNPSGTRVESMTYDPTTGEMQTHSISGWTGSTASPVQEQHTTATTLYNGVEGAAFAPGGAFLSSWLSLPQPGGMKKSIDGPRTDVSDLTTFVYYPIDNAVPGSQRGRLAAIRNAAGHITRYENYDVFGNATRVVNANGVATELTFDHLGRTLTSTIKAVSGCSTTDDPLCATDLTNSRAYVPANGPLASQTDASGNVTAYEYDSRGRLSTISRGPSASDLRERIAYSYDTATGHKSLEQYLANVSGSWVEKRRESFAYDTLSQLTTQTHADSTTVNYTYDELSSVATVRDENHATANTTYVYDPAQRLSTVQQTLGAGTITTSYAYDINSDLTGVTDPNGNLTTYVYDDFGRMLSQTSPVSGTTTYTYDAAGNLSSVTDANNAVTTRVYDALNRVTTSASTLGLSTETVTSAYDGAAPFGLGRLATMTDPAGSTAYTYDRRGLLLAESRTFPAAAYSTSYKYDGNGNRTTITSPSGLPFNYTYDHANRPLTLSQGPYLYAYGATYLPFGPETALQFANGTQQVRTYDSRYRIQRNTLSLSSGIIADYSYTEDAAGNITSIHDMTDATYNRDFEYDDLNRLTKADSGTSLWGATGRYTYDAMGNMLSRDLGKTVELDPNDPNNPQSRRFVARVDALPALGSIHETFAYTPATTSTAAKYTVTYDGIDHLVTYDHAGNEASYFDIRAYSPRNLMSSITEPSEDGLSHAVRYSYDGRGVRLIRSEGVEGGTFANRYYFYTPELQLLAISVDDDSNVYGKRGITSYTPWMKHELAWFNGRPVAQLINGSYVHFTFTDHLGTPILQTDISASIVWRAEYEPYGDIWTMRLNSDGTTVGRAGDQPLRFPGQEYERKWEGAEERYNIARWYRSGWGRYTQVDPIFTARTSPYAYAYASPLRYVDRDGREPAITNPEQRCLLCTVYAEARGQSKACQWAVASVILNRVVEAQQKGKPADVCSIVSAPRQFDGYGNANYQACSKGCRPAWPPELEQLFQNFDRPFTVVPSDATFFANATTTMDNYFGTKLGLQRVEYNACTIFHFWKR